MNTSFSAMKKHAIAISESLSKSHIIIVVFGVKA